VAVAGPAALAAARADGPGDLAALARGIGRAARRRITAAARRRRAAPAPEPRPVGRTAFMRIMLAAKCLILKEHAGSFARLLSMTR
jgi:hypothetical protein